MTNNAIDKVFSTFRERGHQEYHGEPVSQLEHAVQTAELAKHSHPNDSDFILAAFLHDFGHLCETEAGDMDGYGTWDHEAVGARTLRKLGFSEKVARLIENHVHAKRYLVSTDPLYFVDLSPASKITLIKQGGLLTPKEQTDFERDPLFDLHIALRRLDEQAKTEGKPVGDLGWLEELMLEHFSKKLKLMAMIRVLTIDGGGILGIVPAMILNALERKLQQYSNNPEARVVDYFDFFAGTSTGGIITALLLMPDKEKPGRPRYSTDEIVKFYSEEGPSIFKSNWLRRTLGKVGFASDRYEIAELERLLKLYLGETQISELLKPCLIPAYNLELAATYFFCRHDHEDSVNPAREFLVRDVCRATSAAPSYFEPATIYSASKVKHACVDGGVFANNPTLCAIAEVGKTAAHYTPVNMRLLSLGTGKVKPSYTLSAFQKRIMLLNIPDLIQIMMGGVAETTHHIVKNVFCNLNVKNNYLRLDPDMPDATIGAMDNATPDNIQRLRAITEQFIEHNDEDIDHWAKQLVQDAELESAGPVLNFSKVSTQ